MLLGIGGEGGWCVVSRKTKDIFPSLDSKFVRKCYAAQVGYYVRSLHHIFVFCVSNMYDISELICTEMFILQGRLRPRSSGSTRWWCGRCWRGCWTPEPGRRRTPWSWLVLARPSSATSCARCTASTLPPPQHPCRLVLQKGPSEGS